MISEAQISDRVAVTIGHPGGGGFADEPHFIEGRSIDLRPGPGAPNAHPIVKARFDLSPASFWSSNPFGGFVAT
jgi:hypothetical protein